MSKRALFKNVFQQLRRLRKVTKFHDQRLELAGEYAADLESRISDLESTVKWESEMRVRIAKRMDAVEDSTYVHRGDGAQVQPAPAASEPDDGLYTRHHKMIGSSVWASEEETRLPATPAQIKAEAIRLCPEVRVALEVLAAWLTSDTGTVAPYYDGAMMLSSLAEYCECNASGMPEDRLRRMAAKLEAAAREQGR